MRTNAPKGKKAEKESLVRFPGGVSKSPSKHVRYPFCVRWPGTNGKRMLKLFSNDTDALKWAKEKSAELGRTGSDFGSVAEDERAAIAYWRAVVARTAHNPPPPLLDILRDVGARWEAAQKGATVATAVETFLAVKDADGAGKSHKLALKSRLAHFSRDFGERTLATISTAEISKWILGLSGAKPAPGSPAANGKGRPSTPGPLSLQTKKNHRLALHSFFEWCKAEGTVGANPVADSAKVKVGKHNPGILKANEVGIFLAAIVGQAPAIVPFWAVRIFAGIRESEAVRMDWTMIDLAKNKINLPATATKTGKPRAVDIEPALAAFLAPHAKQAGFIAPQSEMARRHALTMARRKMPKGFKVPSNWARHTFATMHLHEFQDAGKTSMQLGHGESPTMLHAHYASFATDTEAAAFWKIRPNTLPQPGNVIPMTSAAPEAAKPATAKPANPKHKAAR
jgi:integrase